MPAPTAQFLSRTVYTTDGVTTFWDFSFTGGYLDGSHVKAYTVTSEGIRTELAGVTLVGPYQIKVSPALAAGATLVIYRDTPKDLPLVDFTDESGFSEISLDTNAKQAVFIAAETLDALDFTPDAAASASATAAASSALAAAGSALAAELSAASIDTANLVNTSTNQTVSGTKTFSNPIQGSVTGSAGTAGTPFAQTLLTATTSAQARATMGISAASGSADVGYTPAGAGAVATTVQAKLRESVSVKDFGATGDGVTDDTAAIQAAVTALPAGGILTGLDKTYVVTCIKLKSNMILKDFKFLTKAGSLPAAFASPVTIGGYSDTNTYSNITVKNVSVDGNRLNVMTGDVAYAEDGGKHGFRVIGSVSNILFEDCTAKYCGSYGFFFYEGINTRTIPFPDTPMQTNVRMVNCTSQNNKAHGMAASSVQYMTLDGCTLTHNGLAYGGDPAGMTSTGHAYGGGIDLEGYGIGSWIGEVKILNTDLRHNGAKSIQIVDPVLTTDPRFVIRKGIQIIDCQLDTGSDATRFSPTACLEITAPAANWALGSVYTDIILQGGSCEGEVWYACVNNFIVAPTQILSTTQLGNGNYSNNVTVYTPSLYSMSGALNGATHYRFVTYETGTWTPVISAGSGSITGYTSSGTYVKIGRQVTLNMTYSITDNGTGGAYGVITGIPFSANTNGGSASTRVSGTSGNQCAVNLAGVEMDIWQYDNVYPWTTGAGGQISITYQANS